MQPNPMFHPDSTNVFWTFYRCRFFSETTFQNNILCSKYDFQIVQIQKFQKKFRKSIIMVKVFSHLTILVVATHKYSIKKLFWGISQNSQKKPPLQESLFNKDASFSPQLYYEKVLTQESNLTIFKHAFL